VSNIVQGADICKCADIGHTKGDLGLCRVCLATKNIPVFARRVDHPIKTQ